MHRYAIIKNDTIENVIVADQEFILSNYPEAIECPDWVGVGDKYEDGEFSRVVVIVEIDEAETL